VAHAPQPPGPSSESDEPQTLDPNQTQDAADPATISLTQCSHLRALLSPHAHDPRYEIWKNWAAAAWASSSRRVISTSNAWSRSR